MIQAPFTQPIAPNAGYVPQAPVYSQMPAEYNAIKINIVDPKVNAPGSVQSPVYSYPQANVYAYPQAQQPVYYPQQMPAPQPAPIAQPAPVAQPIPQTIQQPVPAPQVINTQVNNPAPATVIPEAQPQQDFKSIAPQTSAPVAPAVPEQPAPQEPVAKLDVPAFTAAIKSDDLQKVGDTIEDVAAILQDEPDAKDPEFDKKMKEHEAKVGQLLDTDLMEAMLGVIGKDNSNLEGPTDKQKELRQQALSGKELSKEDAAEANRITPLEMAERNKQYALFTTAILQKSLIDEFKKTNNMTPDIKDLPGMEQIVTTVKDNPNPMLRASALAALAYNARPEYKPVMKEIFELSQKDKDENVQKVAAEGLDKLSKIADTTAQAA